MTEALELEAKFIIRKPEQLKRALAVLRELGYPVRKRTTQQQTDSYFDTSTMALRAAGWAYRCRKVGDVETLYLKSFGTHSNRVHARSEISQSLQVGTPRAMQRMAAGPVRDALLRHSGGHRLHRLFSVETERTSYDVPAASAGQAGFALDVDRTRILTARRGAPSGPLEFTELEIEGTDAAALAALADVLHQRAGLASARYSKYERGLHAAGLYYEAQQAGCRFNGKDAVVDLVFAHLREQCDALQRFEPVAWEGVDPEGVHKMRVAVRRIRAVLKVFGDIVAEDIDKRLVAELRWLAGQLGHARDADVCEIDIARLETLIPDPPTIAPYEAHLRLATANAYIALNDAMASPRYRRVVRRLRQVVDAGPGEETRAAHGDLSVAIAATRMVRQSLRKMRSRGDAIDGGSPPDELHRLRIQAKQLRYLLDLFSAAQPRRWQRPIEALKALQQLLGDHQDAVIAAHRHDAFAQALAMTEANRTLVLTMGQLMQIEQERIRQCRKRFPAAWSHFRAAMPR